MQMLYCKMEKEENSRSMMLSTHSRALETSQAYRSVLAEAKHLPSVTGEA